MRSSGRFSLMPKLVPTQKGIVLMMAGLLFPQPCLFSTWTCDLGCLPYALFQFSFRWFQKAGVPQFKTAATFPRATTITPRQCDPSKKRKMSKIFLGISVLPHYRDFQAIFISFQNPPFHNIPTTMCHSRWVNLSNHNNIFGYFYELSRVAFCNSVN